MGTTPTPDGLDWLALRPEHFNRDLLPARHRKAPDGLFPVTDVLAVTPKQGKTETQLEGQADLFGELG